MDYISEIKALAQEGLHYDPLHQIFGANHHRWQFGKPVDMQKIYDFENDMKVSLPEALVRCLLSILIVWINCEPNRIVVGNLRTG